MRLHTALKYSQYFMYKGEKYYTPKKWQKPKNEAYKLFAYNVNDNGKIVPFTSFCYVKPVIRIEGVIDKGNA